MEDNTPGMTAEILVTGDEILTGFNVDTNSAYIARQLEAWGLQVIRHSCAGDDIQNLVSILKEIGRRADIAIVTGGLGPTSDDITAEAAAKAAGVKLLLNNKALKNVTDAFKARNRFMSASNKKQALLPEGSDCMVNPVGTAPGFYIKIGKCAFFFLPGVPVEMIKIMEKEVLPRIEKFQGTDTHVNLLRSISSFGLPESAIGERLLDFPSQFPEIKLGFQASFPLIYIKLYTRGKDENHLRQRLEKATAWVVQKTGKSAFSIDGKSMEAFIGRLLWERNETLAVAESCTGGLISHMLTNVPGSSNYFLFSGVTYSNEAKIKVLNVPEKTLIKHGAVHEETVKKMAVGVRRLTGATYGLATSGIAGPDGGSPDKPVGTVCIGVATPFNVEAHRFLFTFNKRSMNKMIFAVTALNLLRKILV